MKAKLVVVGGEAKTAEIRLKLPTVIGRGREASLMLPHPLVSRQHCEIFESAGKLVVRDLGSLNGTFINNERITEAELPNGELLTIGTVTFRAVYDSQVEAKASKSSKAKKSGRSERTVGQPSDATVDTSAPQRPTSKTQPAAKTQPSAKPQPAKAPAIAKSKANRSGSDTPIPLDSPLPMVRTDPGKGQRVAAAGKEGPGKGAAPAKSEPFTATHDPTRQLPGKGKAAAAGKSGQETAKKKAWADSSDEVEALDYQGSDDDMELGEDDSPSAPLETPVASGGEFTVNTLQTLASNLPGEDEDDFNVEEIDFSSEAPLPQPALAINVKDKTSFPAGELTTNFEPQAAAPPEKPKEKAKPQTKAPDAKAKAQEAKKASEPKPPKEPAPKGTLGTTDEDLEAFFRSLG